MNARQRTSFKQHDNQKRSTTRLANHIPWLQRPMDTLCVELLAQAISLKVQLACHGTPWLLHPPLKQKTSNRWSSSELVLTDARRFKSRDKSLPRKVNQKLHTAACCCPLCCAAVSPAAVTVLAQYDLGDVLDDVDNV